MTDKTSWFAEPGEAAADPRTDTWSARLRGAMLGGAVGDALGAGVRHRTSVEIQQWFGPRGVVDYVPVFGQRGAVTELSQLTMFTLEALLRAKAANPDPSGWLPTPVVCTNHLRWLYTQGVPWQYAMAPHLARHPEPSGWLLECAPLFSTRNPGGIALRGLGQLATDPRTAQQPDQPVAALGGVRFPDAMVWSAPSMVWNSSEEMVFASAASIANLLTSDADVHGATGLHADVLAQLLRGVRLWDAVSASEGQRLGRVFCDGKPLADVRRAVHAAVFASRPGSPGPADLDIAFDTDGKLGELGIALAAVANTDNFADAVLMAVNQSADSSVTGALAGQLAGAIHGDTAIPARWLEELEVRQIMEVLCDDAAEAFAPPPMPKWAQRYVDTTRHFSGPLELPHAESAPTPPATPVRSAPAVRPLRPVENSTVDSEPMEATWAEPVEAAPVEATMIMPAVDAGWTEPEPAPEPASVWEPATPPEPEVPVTNGQPDPDWEATLETEWVASSPPEPSDADYAVPTDFAAEQPSFPAEAADFPSETTDFVQQPADFIPEQAGTRQAVEYAPESTDFPVPAQDFRVEPAADIAEAVDPPEPPKQSRGHAKPEEPEPAAPSLSNRMLGCLLGGGLGNALGAEIEMASTAEIVERFGPQGPAGVGAAFGVSGAITSDIQCCLFTGEGLIRGSMAERYRISDDLLPEIHLAYQRWLHTQGVPWESAAGAFLADHPVPDGWLVQVPDLFSRRGPGKTVVESLVHFGGGAPAGSFTEIRNESKGSGAIVRVPPVALYSSDPAEVFNFAARTAALTHGHPTAWHATGALAVILQQALLGDGLDDGVWLALQVLETWEDHEETSAMLKLAVELASRGTPAPQDIEQNLGGGWVGEQALAIAVCAALVGGDDVVRALRVAVCHSGDSDTTGAICGYIMGALVGVDGLPAEWLAELELRELLERMAMDCVAEFGAPEAGVPAPSEPEWAERYPVRWPEAPAPAPAPAPADSTTLLPAVGTTEHEVEPMPGAAEPQQTPVPLGSAPVGDFPAPKPSPRRINGVAAVDSEE